MPVVKSVDSRNFSSSGIAKIISHQDPNEVHDNEMISEQMLKRRRNSICKPLSIIFNGFLHQKRFSSPWKYANVVTVHKK